MNRQAIKFLLAGAFLTLAVVALAVATLRDPSKSWLHFTPEEFARIAPEELGGRGVQIDGWVAEGSERFDPSIPELRFEVRDAQGTVRIPVVYRAGLKPDAFQEGQGVVVSGTYDPTTRTVVAVKLMTKCPSKYEAVVPTDSAANSGATP